MDELLTLDELSHLQLAPYVHFWQVKTDNKYKSFVSRETLLIEAELGFCEHPFLTMLMLKFQTNGFVWVCHEFGSFGFISGDRLTPTIEAELISNGVFIPVVALNADRN